MKIHSLNPVKILGQLFINLLRIDLGDKVTVTGWISSGSTFIYQVLNEIGVNVKKEHTISRFNKHRGRIIYTIRDPRDVIVSTAKRHFYKIVEAEGINTAIETAIDYFNNSLRTHMSSTDIFSNKNCLLVRYENFFPNNEVVLTRLLADMFNQSLTDAEIVRIAQKYSIEENLLRSQGIKNFEHMDSESLLHGNHISNMGKSGVYRQYFNAANVEKFNRVLGHLLHDFGYASEMKWGEGNQIPAGA